MPSHTQSPHGRIKDLPDYSYDDVDYGTMLDVAKGRRFKGNLIAMDRNPKYEGMWQDLEQEIQDSFDKKDSQFVLNGSWKRLVGKIDGFAVYAVDSEWVRRNLSVIFMHGGHGYVHEFIPKNEIWIATHHPLDCGCDGVAADRCVSDNYFKSCTMHEITEFKEMAKGISYVDAHETANLAEMELGLLKIPKSALKKATILPMQIVQPWTDANGNPVNPDKMQIQPLRARRDYGEIEAEIAKRMMEASIANMASKIARDI